MLDAKQAWHASQQCHSRVLVSLITCMCSWSIDAVKHDNCYSGSTGKVRLAVCPSPSNSTAPLGFACRMHCEDAVARHTAHGPEAPLCGLQTEQERYTAMSLALRATQRPMLFSMCALAPAHALLLVTECAPEPHCAVLQVRLGKLPAMAVWLPGALVPAHLLSCVLPSFSAAPPAQALGVQAPRMRWTCTCRWSCPRSQIPCVRRLGADRAQLASDEGH